MRTVGDLENNKDILGKTSILELNPFVQSTAIQGPKGALNRLELDEFQVDKYRALSDM